MDSRLKVGLIFLITIAVLVIFFKVILSMPLACLQSPRITDVQIQSIDKNSIKVTWRTDVETYSTVFIKEQDKINEILKKSFSCNFTGNLNLDAERLQDIFKKNNCSFSIENEMPYLIHNGSSYGFSMTVDTKNNSRYLGWIGKSANERNSTYHSVVFDILQPDTEYTFDIDAENACGINSIETVKFRIPEKI